jgi:Ni,Fe-hydrogenase I small subunit
MDFCEALEKVLKSNIIWVEAQSCSGESVMILKAGCKGIEDLFFHSSPVKFISLFSEEKCGRELLNEVLNSNDFILVIEGALPQDPSLCRIGDFTCSDLIQKLAEKAKAIIAVGSCAVNGGILRESGANSFGVKDLIKGKKVFEVLGCPASDRMIVAAMYYALSGGGSG